MTSAVDYRQAGQEYLAHARRALDEGDYPQAPERLWEAAAEMVKAVAESRGWPDNGHTLLSPWSIASQTTRGTKR